MKTVYKVASLVVPVFLVNTFGFLYTLLSLLSIVSVYCMYCSLIQSSRRIKRDLDEAERAERAEELACQEQEAIDEVDAFLMDSIQKRQNRLVLIEKDKKEKDKKE
jgi:uncharacterized membrane protein